MSRALHRVPRDTVELALAHALSAAEMTGYPTAVVVVGEDGRDARVAIGGAEPASRAEFDQVVAMLRSAADRLEAQAERWTALAAEQGP